MPRSSFRGDIHSWEGRHQAYTQTIEGYYNFSVAPPGDALEEYNRVTKELQDMIAEAIQTGKTLRAMGASWSLSKVGVTEHRLINTKNLSLAFPLDNASISPEYAGDRAKLRFMEAGGEIGRINQYLFDHRLSLKASGSNNGQTLAGAVSTGTHGAAFKFGATPDFVVGIHLITGPSTQVYLQRASYPVVNPGFAAALGAELKNDDTLFNAALVSFGSFGIIHGMLIEARELFLLHAYRSFQPFNSALKTAMSTLNFSELNLPKPAADLYHFQVYFNPNEGTPPEEAAVLLMFEAPWTEGYQPPPWDDAEPGPGASGLEIIAALIGAIPDPLTGLARPAVSARIRAHLRPYAITGTFKDLFRNEKAEGKLFVSDIGVPLSRSLEALSIAFDTYANFDTVLPMTCMMRFVAKTKALLGFTKFDPTCTLEIDAPNTPKVREYANAVWTRLEQAGIPFTMHWGKFNWFLTPARVQSMYGENVQKWIDSRETLLSPEVRSVFTNDFLRSVGLAT
ncbi:MAG: FAD/FMN-dependent dehydrogenase [candidate division NC10 bacterium CSP1-5]|nr:MAG: FAD/FMN-dependent dehydrogenase [candidate division NC10 bacterium CSP1-5]